MSDRELTITWPLHWAGVLLVGFLDFWKDFGGILGEFSLQKGVRAVPRHAFQGLGQLEQGQPPAKLAF